jgi:signal transduction histidine kinase
MDEDAETAQLERSARRWRSVLRAVFALLALLVWAAFAEHTAHEHRLALAAVAQRDANLATAVEHYTVRVLRSARAVHRLLGDMVAQGNGDATLQQMLADRLRANDAFAEIGLCLPGPRVLAAPVSGSWLTPASCARVLASTAPGPELSVLPPVAGAKGLQVPLAMAIEADQGERLGVAVALTPAGTMLGIMESLALEDETTVLVIGTDGQPRAAWRSEGGAVRDPGGFAPLAALLSARGGQAAIAGEPYLVSSRAMDRDGLRIQVGTARRDALGAFYQRRLRHLGVYGLATLGLLAAYLLLARMHAESLGRALDLSRARSQLQALNARLDSQVQERTTQLEQAYRDLETFSYTVAHDVRTPLASIAGFALALEPAIAASGDARHLHYLRRIQANATQMEHLTQHLLELGRLTRAPLERARVDLSALAREVVAGLREADPQRVVDVAVEPGLQACGDGALLRQVLENLLGNAWKFTARRAHAHVSFERAPQAQDADAQAFVVSDDGAGFDTTQAAALFQPFRRLHGAQEFPGTGVGLAMVQRIVALHGGKVWADAAPDAGARFYFTLPGREPDA